MGTLRATEAAGERGRHASPSKELGLVKRALPNEVKAVLWGTEVLKTAPRKSLGSSRRAGKRGRDRGPGLHFAAQGGTKPQ